MEQHIFTSESKQIYGEIFLPDNANHPMPTVILSHGLGSTHDVNTFYAEVLAKNGFAAVTFDFCGGGLASKSSGTMLDMSVLTEAEDLNFVIDEVLKMPFAKKDCLFLEGGSQGGFVASYVAAQRPDDIKAMVLLYPAYVLQEGLKGAENVDISTLPETFNIGGLTVGRKYIVDAASFDIYEEISKFSGNVLILHGTNDSVVPISFSERAVSVYSSAKLVSLEGADHGFQGKDDEYAAEMIVDFFRAVL